MARNYQIIHAFQTQVEGRLSTQPGVYDGRKNFFTSFDLEFESGAREVHIPYCHRFSSSICFPVYSILYLWVALHRRLGSVAVNQWSSGFA